MQIIVAVDKNWGIGNKGDLLVHIPEDLKRFRALTTGKIVVMGRKTLESLPKQQPLKDRTNIILTHDKSYHVEGAIVVHTIYELLVHCKALEYNPEDIFIIGGGQIYNQLVSFCDTLYITKINQEYEADTFFPNIDENKKWILKSKEDREYEGLSFSFLTYKRKVCEEDEESIKYQLEFGSYNHRKLKTMKRFYNEK